LEGGIQMSDATLLLLALLVYLLVGMKWIEITLGVTMSDTDE